MTVYFDVSQIVRDPRRTGIQRAERELIRHWPGPAELMPCRFDPGSGEMRELPRAVLTALCADAQPGGLAAELERLVPLLTEGRVVHPRRLLNAELFDDPLRAAYYRTRAASCRAFWIVYDFLPWLSPSWFGNGMATLLMPYLRALRSVNDLAFISAQTRLEFSTRIARQSVTGPVIPMGGDGLGLERQVFASGRSKFVMLGTIEPRKNALQAMQAVRALWSSGAGVGLTMIGTLVPDARSEIALMTEMSRDARFRHVQDVSDHGVRAELRGARALLFPSEGEGYGIPPMEALHAGIPVIAAEQLPALSGQPRLGQIRLAPVSVTSIAAAITTLMDDRAAEGLWQEAARMQVPTWADFARRIAEWVQA